MLPLLVTAGVVGNFSSTRGRVTKVGGMAIDTGAGPRTQADNQILRPAYRVSAAIFQPIGGGDPLGSLFDPKSISFWRLVVVAAAASYITGFHLTLGRVRVPPRV